MPPKGDPERAQAEQDAKKLLEGASEENPVYALINGHWVSVTGVKDGMVTYQDGRGRERTMPLDRFMGKLNTVCFQNGTVPASMDNPAHGNRGGGGNPRGGVDGIGN
jgi:hypothetical protein